MRFVYSRIVEDYIVNINIYIFSLLIHTGIEVEIIYEVYSQ